MPICQQTRSIFLKTNTQKNKNEASRWKPAPSSSELASFTFPLLDSRNGMHSPYLDGANHFNSFFSQDAVLRFLRFSHSLGSILVSDISSRFTKPLFASGGFLGENSTRLNPLILIHSTFPHLCFFRSTVCLPVPFHDEFTKTTNLSSPRLPLRFSILLSLSWKGLCKHQGSVRMIA